MPKINYQQPDFMAGARFRGAVYLDEISAPATPTSGQAAIYVKPNNGLFVKPDNGDEQKLNSNLGTPYQLNLLTYNIHPSSWSQTADAFTTARAVCVQLPWHTTETVGKYYVQVGTAGASLSATGLQCSAWLTTGAGVLIPNTATATLSTTLTSTGVKALSPSAGAQVISADPAGYIYFCLLQTGTTPAIMRGQNPGAATCNLGLTAGTDPLLSFRNGSTQTAPGDIALLTNATLWNTMAAALGP